VIQVTQNSKFTYLDMDCQVPNPQYAYILYNSRPVSITSTFSVVYLSFMGESLYKATHVQNNALAVNISVNLRIWLVMGRLKLA
jgi:hypothetical protein